MKRIPEFGLNGDADVCDSSDVLTQDEVVDRLNGMNGEASRLRHALFVATNALESHRNWAGAEWEYRDMPGARISTTLDTVRAILDGSR